MNFKWTYGRIRNALYRCATWSEFRKEYESAYSTAIKRYGKCEIKALYHREGVKFKWTLPWLLDSTVPYDTFLRWTEKEVAAYHAARRLKLVYHIRESFNTRHLPPSPHDEERKLG